MELTGADHRSSQQECTGQKHSLLKDEETGLELLFENKQIF